MPVIIYIIRKKRDDLEIILKLRAKNKIITTGILFKASDALEIGILIGRGVLKPIKEDTRRKDITIFKLRIVRKMKGKMTNVSYKKSRLVIQRYGDAEKRELLI
jgi:hypothetical protein